MVALLFLRCIICVSMENFKIAANMEAAGFFDDIILIYQLLLSDNLYCALFQLKHKLTQGLMKTNLSQPKGKFSLHRYFPSYMEIRASASTNPDLKVCGNFDNFKFFLYTNAVAEDELDQFNVSPFDDKISFNTSANGKILSLGDLQSFGLDTLKTHNCEVGIKEDFLKSFHIYASQANEEDLEVLIKEEIKNLWQMPEKVTDIMYTELFNAMSLWWRDRYDYLTSRTDFWLKIIKKQIKTISENNIIEFNSHKITFKTSSLTYLENKISEVKRGIINVVANARYTCLTALKVYLVVNGLDSDDKTCIVVSLKTLVERSNEIVSAWKSRWCSALIVECEADPPQLTGIVSTLITALQEMKGLVLILVSTKANEFCRILQCKTRHFLPYEDQCHWSDLTEETQEHLLDKTINFQGSDVVLRSIIGEDNSFTDQLSAASISELMQPAVRVGHDIAKTIDYFIPRTLVSGDGTSMSIDSTTDVEERVVLVTAKPGMGKSTLLTHLAKTAKNENPSLWIAKLDLVDCTSYLKNLNAQYFNELTATNFFEEFCTDSESVFGKELLRHCLLDEKMILMLDGVDEVCPSYEDKIVPLLKWLLTTNLKQIWITSRTAMKLTLENILGVQISRQLSYFTQQDQENFLTKVWLSKNALFNLNAKSVTTFAKELIALTAKSFNGTSLIIGIPQMTLMLSESYVEHLVKHWPSLELTLPKRLDTLYLYESFVQKMFNNYLIEKKKLEIDLAANKSDIEIQQKRFFENHTLAALMLILTPEEFDALGMDNLADFLMEIKYCSEKTGLIDKVSKGKAHFIHRTLAEYLLAKWFADNYKTNRSLLESKIIQPSFKVIREFLDRILARNFQLHTAILNCDINAIDNLLYSGMSIDETDDGGRTALHIAVSCSGSERHPDFVAMVQKLLEHGASTDLPDDVLGWRPLQLADKLDAWTVAGLILQAGGDESDMKQCRDSINELVYKELTMYLRTKDSSCHRLINISAREGELKILQYLLEEREEYNVIQGVDRAYPMHHAASGGCINVMQYLYSKGIPYDVADDDGNFPLHCAVKVGDIQCVKFLVEQSDNVNRINKRRESALMFAVKLGDAGLDVVKYLLDHGSDTGLTNIDGRSALHSASMHGGLETIKCLIDKRTDTNIQTYRRDSTFVKTFEDTVRLVNTCDNDGNSPFHLAASHGHLPVLKYLLDIGAKEDTRNNDCNSYLLLAASHGHLCVVKHLLDTGGKVDVIYDAGNSPLHLAALNGHLSVVKHFLDIGSKVDVLNHAGNSSLHLAASHGHLLVVKHLLDTGAEVNVLNYTGNSSLHLASSRGHLDVVKCLSSHGDSIEILNNDKLTALDCALEQGRQDVVAYLTVILRITADSGYPLHHSVKIADISVLHYFINRGADINERNVEGNTALWIACKESNLVAARYLLDNGASMKTGEKNYSLLHASALSGDPEMIQLLLKRGCDIEALSTTDESALLLAAKYGKCDAVRALLDAGASMRADNKGFTPLHASAVSGDLQVIQLLLERVADIDAVTMDGNSALWLSAKYGKCDAVKVLLDAGASMMADNKGFTPLHASAELGDPQVIQLLLGREADIEAVTMDGNSALWLAAKYGKCKAVKALLDAGASMRADYRGYTPLHTSAVSVDLQVLQLLLGREADIEAVTMDGNSALWLAAKYGKCKAVKALLDAGASMRADYKGYTPLHTSAVSGDLQVLQLLLGREADIDAVTIYGISALWLAAKYGKCKAVRALLDAGASMRADNKGYTPLHTSAVSGDAQVIQLLLEYEADIEAVTREKETPLHVAVMHNQLQVVKLLIKHGANRNSKTSRNMTPLDIATKRDNHRIGFYLQEIGSIVTTSILTKGNYVFKLS